MASKIHEPTASRLRRAREEGDLAVSPSASRWLGFVAGVLLLPSLLAVVGLRCIDSFKRALAQPNPSGGPLLQRLLEDLALTLLPWLGLLALASIAATLLQTRGWFSAKQLSPKPGRLDPTHAWAQAVDRHQWLSLLVTLVGAIAVGGAALVVIVDQLQSFANTAERPLAAAPLGLVMIERLLWATAALGLCIAVIDWLIRRSALHDRLRMTHAEWLDDQKQTYGHPAIRAERIKQHRELLDER